MYYCGRYFGQNKGHLCPILSRKVKYFHFLLSQKQASLTCNCLLVIQSLELVETPVNQWVDLYFHAMLNELTVFASVCNCLFYPPI